MINGPSEEERRILSRIAREPFYFLRQNLLEIKENQAWENSLHDLIDQLKAVWQDSRALRIPLCFALHIGAHDDKSPGQTIHHFESLQKKQNQANSRLVFVIDLSGNIIEELDMGEEIEPVCIMNFSKMREVVMFWLHDDFRVYCKGYPWNAHNKREVLIDIKSKKRERLLSMEDHRAVLKVHYEQYIRAEAQVTYWFEKDKYLIPTPEKAFRKSLWGFLNREVDCTADQEPMFKDNSRCDVRIWLENGDLYFVEIKWIGASATRERATGVVSTRRPLKFGVDRAIDGAYQTKLYIEKNDSIEYDHRVKLGIYLVYDAYAQPKIPIDYGVEINKYPLLDIAEYQLVTLPPSSAAKGRAKRQGLA